MATTAIIVEMLIIGLFAGIWIVLFLIKLAGLDVESLLKGISNYQPFITALIFIVIALLYQLGWMINWMCSLASTLLGERKLKNKIFQKDKSVYISVRAFINQYGSPELHRELNIDRSVIRLSRAGVINFILISIGMFLLQQNILGSILIIFSIICAFQWYHRYMRYYNKSLASYKVIVKKQDNRRNYKRYPKY